MEAAAEYTRVNVLGTAHLLDAAHEVVPEARVVLVSSAEVYGIVREEDLPLSESFATAPANPYSTSKLEAELVAREAVRTRQQGVVIARPFNHIGPGQSPTFVVPALVRRMLDATAQGLHFIMVGDLSTVATSVTFATWCARIGCSPSGAARRGLQRGLGPRRGPVGRRRGDPQAHQSKSGDAGRP